MPLLVDEMYIKYLADKVHLRASKSFIIALSDMVKRMFIESAKIATEDERVVLRVEDLSDKAFICIPKKPKEIDTR